MNRLFLLLAPCGTAEKECFFAAIRGRAELDLHVGPGRLPVLLQQLALKFLEHGLGRADQVPCSSCAHEVEILFAHHAAIHHPYPLGFAVLLLHHLDHFFHGGHIGPVSVEDFEGQRPSRLYPRLA